MSRSHLLAILAVIVALAVGGAVAVQFAGPRHLSATLGGPFQMTAHDGRRITQKDLSGRPYVLFFGYTYCPDVCPTTLLELTTFLQELGPAADRALYVFVSVDPERDTPAALKAYLASFDPRIIGLTGTPPELAAIARAYRAVYQKVASGSSYTMNHSAMTYLMDARGQFAGSFTYQEPTAAKLAKLKALLQQAAP